MKILLRVLMVGLLFLYPFAVYFGLNYFSPSHIAFFLLTLLLIRVGLFRHQARKIPWLLPATFLGMLAILLSLLTDTTLGFKLYPLAVNVAMLVVFGYSYVKPPTVIECLARLTDKNFPERAISYTQKVTLYWCVFFVINGLASVYTAIYTPLEIWMIYNGFLSYLFMGLFMGGEYIVRLKVKRLFQQSSLTQITHDGSQANE